MSGNVIHMLKDTDRKNTGPENMCDSLSDISLLGRLCCRLEQTIECLAGQMEWRTLFCSFMHVVGHSDKHIWICVDEVCGGGNLFRSPTYTNFAPKEGKMDRILVGWKIGNLLGFSFARPKTEWMVVLFLATRLTKDIGQEHYSLKEGSLASWLAGWLLLQNNCHIITQAGRVVAEAKRQWVSCRDNKQPLL